MRAPPTSALSRDRRLRWRVSRSAAAATLVLTALAAPRSPASAVRPTTAVFVVGDSLTVGASEFGGLSDKFADAGYRISVVARQGQGVKWGLSTLQNTGRSLPAVVVVGLGTNDVASGRSVESFGEYVDAIMDTVGDDRTVVWMNLDMQGPPWGSQAARYNRLLLERTGRHSNLEVADWNGYVDQNRTWVVSDNIHLNAKGYRQRAWFSLWQVQAAN